MKKNISQLLILAVALAVGCAAPYQPKARRAGIGVFQGFSETQLATDIFQINYRGNQFSSVEQIEDFCSLRAADVAIQNGFPFFVRQESKHVFEEMLGQLVIKCFKTKPEGGVVLEAAFVQQAIRQKYNISK